MQNRRISPRSARNFASRLGMALGASSVNRSHRNRSDGLNVDLDRLHSLFRSRQFVFHEKLTLFASNPATVYRSFACPKTSGLVATGSPPDLSG